MAEIEYREMPPERSRWQITPDYWAVLECESVTKEEIDDWVDDADEKWYSDELSVGRKSDPFSELKERFLEQADKWEGETGHLSSPSQRMAHPSYQAILGMARHREKEIITLLITDMRERGRPWFGALSYITRENPIDRADAGKMDKMIAAWIQWGQRMGLL